ncbi:MAG: GTP-binding protein [Candidatus Bilamarchaeaceae archaeon]
MGIQEKIRQLEEEIRRTQYNKATEFHIGRLKAKIAKLKRELISPSHTKTGKAAGGFDIKKGGDATVAIIGLPSVGKSTLLTELTNAQSKVAAYAFTTLKCIPGMLEYNGARIQVLDLPGIIEGAKDGRGRGREIISVARSADLLLILLDATNPDREYETIMRELYGFGIRVNTKPPEIAVKKTLHGGITISSTVKLTKISETEVNAVLGEYGIYSADVVFRSDASIDELIDVLEGNRVYLPAIIAINKIDLVGGRLDKKLQFEYIPISAENGVNIELLKERIYRKLDFIRVYTKKRGEKVDMEEPLIVRRGTKVSDVCERLHRELKSNFKYALVWGKSVKHPGQRVGLEHVLADGDVIQIVKR